MKKSTLQDIHRAFKALEERDELLENIIAEIRSHFRKEVNNYTVGRNYGLLIAILIIEQYKAEREDKE